MPPSTWRSAAGPGCTVKSAAEIVGPRTMEQLESAVRAVGVQLDDKALAKRNEIFPGDKTSPEDYGW